MSDTHLAQATLAQPGATQEAAARPWERLPGEPYAAYSRFVAYRNTPPGERAIRKLGLHARTAFRYAKKWRWFERATAYDLWQLETSDHATNTARLERQRLLIQFGFASLNKALCAVKALDETKVSPDEAITLAESGSTLSGKALGITDSKQNVAPPVSSNVSVNFGFANVQRDVNQAVNKDEVVLPAEQVLDGTKRAIVDRLCPSTEELAPMNRLPTLRVKAPKRRDE